MASKDLTVTFYIGNERVDKLTDDQAKRIAQKFGEALSSYYSRNIDEYARLKQTGDNKDGKSK